MPQKRKLTRYSAALIGVSLVCLLGYLLLHGSITLARIKSEVVRIDIFDVEEFFKNDRKLREQSKTAGQAIVFEAAVAKATFQTIDTPSEVQEFLNRLNVARFNFQLLGNCKCEGQQKIILTYSDGSTTKLGLAHDKTLKLENTFGDLALTARSCELAREISAAAEFAFDKNQISEND